MHLQANKYAVACPLLAQQSHIEHFSNSIADSFTACRAHAPRSVSVVLFRVAVVDTPLCCS